ncbi:MAG: DNA polymerase III subunit delta [Pseudomonadota bacterium]|nr:DNA polymerase III subunit delta [Pseudomonadota bacterium]
MKLSHKEFTRAKTIPQLPIYLIHGSPRHLQNEIERKICSHYKGSNFSEKKNFIVDTNFNLEELRNELELIPLFGENRILILNIVSNTIPQKVVKILKESKIPDDLRLIIKLGKQPYSFKKTSFYEFCSKSNCIVEIFELKGNDLRNWVKQKFLINKLNYSDKIFSKILNKTEGNTLSIAQELYKMSLLKLDDLNSYFDIVQNDYKFSENDLIDALFARKLSKSLKILDYLQSVNFPEPLLIFLLNNEFKKIYSLSSDTKLAIYIPNYKMAIYNDLSSQINHDVLSNLIQYCHEIDKTIKLGPAEIEFWHQLEILISCFILNKTVNKFIG